MQKWSAMCTTHYTHLGSVISSPCCPSGTSPTWPIAYQWSPEKHFRVWIQLTCPKISRELLLPQLLSSPSLGKSNHLEFYLAGGGQVERVDLPIYLQKLLYRSLRNFSLNFRFVESSVFGRIHMSLAFCSCNSDWDHTFRSVFRVQPEAHHHPAHLELPITYECLYAYAHQDLSIPFT